MWTRWSPLTQSALALTFLLSVIGCGGGTSSAFSLNEESSSLNGISVNINEAQGSNRAVTAQAFSTCPTEELTPVDMNKVACMVGKYEGARYDEKWNRIGPADERCSVTVLSDGRVTLSVPGVVERNHQFSHDKFTETTKDNFSSYQSRNRNSTDFSSFDTSPSILLESQFRGTGSVRWADYYGLLLGQGADGWGGILSVWMIESIIQDQIVRCSGPLEAVTTDQTPKT